MVIKEGHAMNIFNCMLSVLLDQGWASGVSATAVYGMLSMLVGRGFRQSQTVFA